MEHLTAQVLIYTSQDIIYTSKWYFYSLTETLKVIILLPGLKMKLKSNSHFVIRSFYIKKKKNWLIDVPDHNEFFRSHSICFFALCK